MILLLLCLTLFDADFAKTLLRNDNATWLALTNDAVPLETQKSAVADLVHQLEKTVPLRFLIGSQIDYKPETAEVGKIYQMDATVIGVKPFADESDVFRCQAKMKDGTEIVVLVPSVPKTWNPDSTTPEHCSFTGLLLRKGTLKVFVAPVIHWYPNTFLGNIHFDVGSFDKIPVKRVTEIDGLDDETKRLAFQLTDKDNEAFYGLLRCFAATVPGTLEREARNDKFPVTDLFNAPATVRGRPVLLFGTAKRILVTDVKDADTRAVFGVDRYYQIYLFTDESQGNPIVVCVTSLPEGMPTGDAADFAVPLAVAAVPYKLWIYNAVNGQQYAPLLIGRCPIWNPPVDNTAAASQTKPNKTLSNISIGVFFVLLLVWLFLKRRRWH